MIFGYRKAEKVEPNVLIDENLLYYRSFCLFQSTFPANSYVVDVALLFLLLILNIFLVFLLLILNK